MFFSLLIVIIIFIYSKYSQKKKNGIVHIFFLAYEDLQIENDKVAFSS